MEEYLFRQPDVCLDRTVRDWLGRIERGKRYVRGVARGYFEKIGEIAIESVVICRKDDGDDIHEDLVFEGGRKVWMERAY